MKAKLYAVIALLAVVLVFALQNTAAVDFRFLFWKVSVSRALLVGVLFGSGALTGWLLGAIRRISRHI